MYKKILFCVTLALLYCFTACNRNANESDAYGVFEATEIIISSEANGRVLEFNVQEGNFYQKGEQLGYIDTIQLYLQIQQLDASIKAALARRPDIPSQVRTLQDKLSTLEKEEMRLNNLVNANAASTKDLDNLIAEINITKSQIAATKSTLNTTSQSIIEEVEAMRFQKMQLTNAIEKCHLHVPISGTILKKYIETNELAYQGRPLYKIADLNNMYIQVYVTEDQLASLRIGQKVKVNMDAGSGNKQFDGKITWISPKAEFTPKMIQTKKERVNLVYAVKVWFKNDGSAKIGMPGDVNFE